MIRKTAHPEITRQTLWGLSPIQLHDRFWAARGVQVVRQGENNPIVEHARYYLLTAPDSLAIFRLNHLLDTFRRPRPVIVFLRLHNNHDTGYHERILADHNNRFVAFQRDYGSARWRLGRVAITAHAHLARLWQQAPGPRNGWRTLRRNLPTHHRATRSIQGSAYDYRDQQDVLDFVRHLVQSWPRPAATIPRARRLGDHAWADHHLRPASKPRFIGPVWVGAGVNLRGINSVVGPAVIWDDPHAKPEPDHILWQHIQPEDPCSQNFKPRRLTSLHRAGKRIFDLAFAFAALAITVPFYPLIMLAIFIEDGRPFFFLHRREALGANEFLCFKFRTMRKNADTIKTEFQNVNHSDGPHFFIERDPRLTGVGSFLRKFNIDEMPQFLNVVSGHMSVVGPRPSPRNENQYCPSWREARLSVRPGITGLWQVERSRKAGLDFQEWIRYDIEYVENLTWSLDLRIIGKTILTVLRLR